ncbi:hypothetical protein [Brevundimonas sp.]|uniref:hypothetical protein n=1 Tax=Brevundimonas sp. TaxID=1871086 RepID=UPI00286B5841|nr:hypothetical protein [Brevundimonas sp.]
MAILVQDSATQPSTVSALDGPQAAYADNIRCIGVLYVAQQDLRQRDPRQREIMNSLTAINGRLEEHLAAGHAEEATIAADIQRAVNDARPMKADALEDCFAASGAPSAP